MTARRAVFGDWYRAEERVWGLGSGKSEKRPPSSEKSMKSGISVLRPSSKIMDPSFERAEEQFRRAAPKFFVPTLRVHVLGKDQREHEKRRERS